MRTIKIGSYTNQNQRSQNEDNRLVIPKVINGKTILIAAVFDGMGGTDAGEVASKMAKDNFDKWFEENAELIVQDFPISAKTLFAEQVVNTSRQICLHGRHEGVTLGTTMTLLLLYEKEYVAINSGDSRIYKFSNKPLQITKDHTLAQVEVDKGNITEEEYVDDKRSHMLTQCLGTDRDPDPDFFKGKYKEGDIFLICSDGMYNRVNIEDMSKLAKGDGEMKDRLAALAEHSISLGEKDNITGILIEV